MGILQKNKKIYVCSIGLLAFLIGGSYWTLSRTSLFTGSWNVISECSFNPDISEKNKKLIDETITTVAHKGVFSLLGDKSHLEDMGRILSKEVPDLAYWAYILNDPKLKSDMMIIRKSSPKYNGFIDGTADRLLKESKENPCLLQQAKGFAKYVGLPEDKTVEVLKECLEKGLEDEDQFEKFLDYILTGKELES